eukprot:847006-Pyramimonas_sp.AAC.1
MADAALMRTQPCSLTDLAYTGTELDSKQFAAALWWGPHERFPNHRKGVLREVSALPQGGTSSRGA